MAEKICLATVHKLVNKRALHARRPFTLVLFSSPLHHPSQGPTNNVWHLPWTLPQEVCSDFLLPEFQLANCYFNIFASQHLPLILRCSFITHL